MPQVYHELANKGTVKGMKHTDTDSSGIPRAQTLIPDCLGFNPFYLSSCVTLNKFNRPL